MWWSQKEKKKFGGQNWRVFCIIKRLSDKRNYVHWFPLHSCSTAHNVRDFNIFFLFYIWWCWDSFSFFSFLFLFFKAGNLCCRLFWKKKKNPLTANMGEDNIVFWGGDEAIFKIFIWLHHVLSDAAQICKKKKAPWGKKYNIINDFWWLWIQIDSSSPIRTPDGRNDQIKNLEKKKVKSCLLVATRRSVRQELRQQATFLFVQLFHDKINPPLRGLYCSLPPASSPQQDHQKKKNTTLFSRSPRITRLYSGNGTLELERIYMNI